MGIIKKPSQVWRLVGKVAVKKTNVILSPANGNLNDDQGRR
jgi:hypothetical protein